MSEHILPSKLYWGIWAILICLTVVTALVAQVDLGWFNPVAALLIATGKATIVVLFFMHVKYTSEKLTAMKKRTTMVALPVAISSAATGLNHPRSDRKSTRLNFR